MSVSDSKLSVCIPCGVKRWACDSAGPPCSHCAKLAISSLCSYTWTLDDGLFAVFAPKHNLNDRIKIPAAEMFLTTETGAFGIVRRVDSGSVAGVLAVKTLRSVDGNESRTLQLSAREAWTWSQLDDHLNIVPFIGIADFSKLISCLVKPGTLCLVSRWIDGGDIITYLKKHSTTSKTPLLLDIATGVQYLHSKNIIHADLKGNNVLIDTVDGHPRARLTDFGLSYLEVSRLEFDLGWSSTADAGNRRWLAFERCSPTKYGWKDQVQARSEKSDVFEMMRTFLEVLTGKWPFAGVPSNKLQAAIDLESNPERPSIDMVSDDMWAMMSVSWSTDRDQRPSVAKIREFVASLL